MKRTDANHKEILDYCRKKGASAFSTHAIGKGFPDIVMGYEGRNYLLEVKDGRKAPSQRKLTEAEVSFHQKWKGIVHIVNSPIDIDLIIQNKI
jgi:Holliday junction resolvase